MTKSFGQYPLPGHFLLIELSVLPNISTTPCMKLFSRSRLPWYELTKKGLTVHLYSYLKDRALLINFLQQTYFVMECSVKFHILISNHIWKVTITVRRVIFSILQCFNISIYKQSNINKHIFNLGKCSTLYFDTKETTHILLPVANWKKNTSNFSSLLNSP